jgi:hypothetical protein
VAMRPLFAFDTHMTRNDAQTFGIEMAKSQNRMILAF